MLATQDTVRNFMVWTNFDSSNQSENAAIISAANELSDLLKIRIQDKSIQEVTIGLLPQVFDLRIQILEWLTINDNFFNIYFKEVDSLIQEKLHNSLYSTLEETQAKVLMLQKQIVKPLADEIQADPSNLLQGLSGEKPNYETIKYFSTLSPQVMHFKRWLDASLNFELGLILADMIMLEEIKIHKNRIENEITQFLNDEIVKFGAYSALIKAWTPPVNHESDLISQIEILVSMKELESGSYHEVKKDDLYNFIHN